MRKQSITCPVLYKTYLKNYENRDKKHPKNTKYDAIENFKGIVHSTRTKDCHCICFWFLILIGLASMAGLCSRKFFIQRIFKPMDFRADICGEFSLGQKRKSLIIRKSCMGKPHRMGSICKSMCYSMSFKRWRRKLSI